jgi:pterin-4a-carbinolamine dehydratase
MEAAAFGAPPSASIQKIIKFFAFKQSLLFMDRVGIKSIQLDIHNHGYNHTERDYNKG